MFNHTSRYYSLETATLNTAEGRQVAYKRRRFLPDPTAMQTLTEVEITQGDRLDLITAKTLGDPEQFWRVCDINNVMNPLEVTATIGRRIKIPLPQFEDR